MPETRAVARAVMEEADEVARTLGVELEIGVEQRLQGWQKDPALAGLRDGEALAKLPAEEREACRKVWAAVAALLKGGG